MAAFSGADLAEDWKGWLPCAWPVTEDIKMPPHFPLAVDEARYQGDGVAVVIAESRALAKDAAELVEVDYEPLRPSPTSRRRSRTARRSSTRTLDERVLRLEARDRRRPGRDRRRRRRRHAALLPAALIPNAIEPRGVLAQAGPDRRGHALVGDAGPAHPALRAAARARDPRVEDPRDRPGRRRRLRIEAERLRERRRSRRARATARAARQVDGGARRELRRDHPRPRRRARADVRGDQGRDDHRRQVGGEVRDGRIPPARHARDSAARRVALLGPYDDPELQRHLHRRLHEHDADRRVPRRRPAGGDLRARAHDGRARRRARHGPRRAAAEELRQRVPAHDGVGPDDRLG